MELQKTLDANYGGTELLRPLQAIYKQELVTSHPRQVQFVYTRWFLPDGFIFILDGFIMY